jgi:hypothetical protein
MARLEDWLREQIEGGKAEPNSGLGQAITYMRKHWVPLTLFLREPGAPLDKNLCEAILKRAIMHCKNSLFYRPAPPGTGGSIVLSPGSLRTSFTNNPGGQFWWPNGGQISWPLTMSLIHTAELTGVEPFEYLIELLKHPEDVERDPASWMPWSYQVHPVGGG